jgi:hypothetical protein
VNSKNTKLEIHKKMADRFYNGLIVAEVNLEQVDQDSSKRSSSNSELSRKEDVEYSYAIVIDNLLPSYPSYGDPGSSFMDG